MTPIEPAVAMPPLMLGDSRPADSDYVTALRETGQSLIALDSQYGGDEVATLALRVFQAASGKPAAGDFKPGVRRDLEAAIGREKSTGPPPRRTVLF